jgi:cytidine deaminase
MVKAILEVSRPAPSFLIQLISTKRTSPGLPTFLALVVASPNPLPTTTPCGICRQFLFEFLEPDTPIYVVASTYPAEIATPPKWLSNLAGEEAMKFVRIHNLRALLPDAYGATQLGTAPTVGAFRAGQATKA